jgi:hypothetical protein
MAWESRHKHHRYYYRKRRIKGRVISEYVGSGPLALLIAELDQAKQEEAREKRREQIRMAKQDQEIDHILDLSIDLARAALLLAGCYNHKGEWRRHHGKRIK